MQENQTTPTVEVWLLEPVERMQGHLWTRYDDGRPLETIAIEKPCDLVIHLPSGRVISMQAKAVTFTQESKIITSIAPLPLMNLVSSQEALSEIENMGNKLSIDKTNDFWEKIGEWKKQELKPSGFTNKLVSVKLEEKTLLEIELKADASGSSKWFVVYDFTRPLTEN